MYSGRPNYRKQIRAQARSGRVFNQKVFDSKTNEYIEYPPDWDIISKQIRARDGYRCKVSRLYPERQCNAYFPPPFMHLLHVHHIVPLPNGSSKPNNLLSLCRVCHGHLHGRYFGHITDKQRHAAARW